MASLCLLYKMFTPHYSQNHCFQTNLLGFLFSKIYKTQSGNAFSRFMLLHFG